MMLHLNMGIEVIQCAVCLLAVTATWEGMIAHVHALDVLPSSARSLGLLGSGNGDKGVHLGKHVSGTIGAHEHGSGSPDSDDLLAAVVAEPVGRRAGAATAWHLARFGRHRWPPSLDGVGHTWPALRGCGSREPDHEADPGRAGSGGAGSLGTG